jgi:hypothetical protein
MTDNAGSLLRAEPVAAYPTGSVYGQIAGVFYGYVDIPRRWRDIVSEIAVILRLADALAGSP